MSSKIAAICASIRDFPTSEAPDVAIAGRSNCGKSSLINALLRERVARTSSTPGRTQQIFFFHAALPDAAKFTLVDLPGFGFARAAKRDQSAWNKLVDDYLNARTQLAAIVLLSDIRRDLGDEERDFLEWIDQRNLKKLLVLTKADKLNKSERFSAQKRIAQAAKLKRPPLVSSVHLPETIEALRQELAKLVPPA